MNALDIALICKAMGDSSRLEIIRMISNEEKCACELLEAFDITQPTLSHHMKVLCDCGLVHSRKDGKWVHYTLNRATIEKFKDFISKLT